MKQRQLFEEFYNFFVKNPNGTYYALSVLIENKYGSWVNDFLPVVDRIEDLRRNLQKQQILKCTRYMLGKGNIGTVKIFDENKVKKYMEFLERRNK